MSFKFCQKSVEILPSEFGRKIGLRSVYARIFRQTLSDFSYIFAVMESSHWNEEETYTWYIDSSTLSYQVSPQESIIAKYAREARVVSKNLPARVID